MHAAGFPVPEPLALGTLANGDRLLALRWIDGAARRSAAQHPRRAARLLAALAALVRRVHEAGFVRRPARRQRSRRARPCCSTGRRARPRAAGQRARDLAPRVLAGAARVARRRLRVRAPCSACRERGRAVRDTLRRAAPRPMRARGTPARAASACRPGRLAAAFEAEDARGLRLRELGSEALTAIRAAHRAALAARDGRVCKSDARSS
jgi:hypothetical protein